MPKVKYDQNLLFSDFVKVDNPTLSHMAFESLEDFRAQNQGALPKSWDIADAEKFLKIAREYKQKYDEKDELGKKFDNFMRSFAFTCAGQVAPLAAFIGGFVSQEAVKSMTNKFVPITQFFYNDVTEIIPELPEQQSEIEAFIKEQKLSESTKDRYQGLRAVVGQSLIEKLSESNMFMVGVGAIGCELLKNFAMVGVARAQNAKMTITDPDVIETSNLNRQFLFREKHLRKPKS